MKFQLLLHFKRSTLVFTTFPEALSCFFDQLEKKHPLTGQGGQESRLLFFCSKLRENPRKQLGLKPPIMLSQFTLVIAFENLDSFPTRPRPPFRCLAIDFSACQWPPSQVLRSRGWHFKATEGCFLCYNICQQAVSFLFYTCNQEKLSTKRVIMNSIVDAWRSTGNALFCRRTTHGEPRLTWIIPKAKRSSHVCTRRNNLCFHDLFLHMPCLKPSRVKKSTLLYLLICRQKVEQSSWEMVCFQSAMRSVGAVWRGRGTLRVS